MTRPDADIAAATAAHAALLDTIARLDDDGARAPSLLPDWSVGHLLTHLARNADSFVGMVEAAARGEVAAQYPGGPEQRAADIEAGAGRPAADLIDDVATSCIRLEAAWAGLAEPIWTSGTGRTGGVEIPIAILPVRRWREVEIHHSDLGLAFTWRNWSDDFVFTDLPKTLADLPNRLSPADRAALLAWLLGRAAQPDLDALAPWQVEQRQARQ